MAVIERSRHALQQAHGLAIGRRSLYLRNHGHIQAVPIDRRTIHKHKVSLHAAPQMAQAQQSAGRRIDAAPIVRMRFPSIVIAKVDPVDRHAKLVSKLFRL